MNRIYPWQNAQWQLLLQRWHNKTLPHALLLTGPEGMGKLVFAKTVAALLLCHRPNESIPCDECHSCRLRIANTHPDLLIVQPEESGKMIKIDQVRELNETLSKTSQLGGWQVVLLQPAAMLNLAAANALLKTLEEPSGNVIILLITAHPNSLPATVRSRCQQIVFKAADNAIALAWLQKQVPTEPNPQLLLALAEGAPLTALAYAGENFLTEQKKFLQHTLQLISGEAEAVKCAASYSSAKISTVLAGLFLILLDIVRLKLSGSSQFLHLCGDNDKLLLEKINNKISLGPLFQLQDEIIATQKLLSKHINLNSQLVLEKLFIQLSSNF